jgi:site-specific recombinase XerD
VLETYFVAPKTLIRLRSGPSEPYIDGFAETLKEKRYSHSTAIRYLRAAAHLGYFLAGQGKTLTDIDPMTPESFRLHFATCRCLNSNGGKINHHTYFGAKCYQQYLQQIGVVPLKPAPMVEPPEPALLASFRHWLHCHRGAAQPTIRLYCKSASLLLSSLSDDVSRWNTQQIRAFFLDQAKVCGMPTLEKRVTAIRIFLRYLIACGHCAGDLDHAVPVFAHWRLAALPRCLSPNEVDQLIDGCAGNSTRRIRDRAIILLLLRLGLRAGDVAGMCIDDIDWSSATLRVMGKSRYEVSLPLSQEVGDAILHYLESRPQSTQTNKLFVSYIAPFRPFMTADGVSSVVKRALRRGGVNTPCKGAHVLRHTAATQMLRNGVPLDKIGLVLRHQGLDTTAHYAKVDVGLLKQVVQSWPGALE